jgi:hypothetical protein
MRSDEWLAEQDREVDRWFRIETRKITASSKKGCVYINTEAMFRPPVAAK